MTQRPIPDVGLPKTEVPEDLPSTVFAEDGPQLALPKGDGPLGDPDRYAFRGVLGIGGMGQVELRTDERIGRDVAVKIATAAGPRVRARFVREALLQARLEHPAFVPVYDIGIDRKGEHFFTMRRVKGRTLHTILFEQGGIVGERGTFTQHRLLAAFSQLCLAVDFAHARGVVHRDLKPANVMLGDFGEIYVLDWGIAKVTGESEDLPAMSSAKIVTGEVPVEDLKRATQEGSALGTFGYMAPEQMRGEHATLDRRADVYSLGAILFEILTNESFHRGGVAEIVASTLNAAGEGPRDRKADVAPELDAICRCATSVRREGRYASARALGDAVERYLEGDRDQALRRKQATALAEGALKAVGSSGGHRARAEAGREAVRALAFDPDNAIARRVLVDVVTKPPSTEPSEAIENANAAQRTGGLALTRWYATMLGAVLTFFSIVLLASGVRDWPLLLGMLASGFGAAALIAYGALVRGGSGRWITAGFVLLCTANALLTRWLGPFIAVPLSMLVNTVAMTFYGTRGERRLRLSLAIVAVTLPVVLDMTGIVPSSFEVHPDRLILFAEVASFPSWLPWMLAAMSAGMLSSTLIVIYFLDQIALLQRRVHVQAWMLERVVGTTETSART